MDDNTERRRVVGVLARIRGSERFRLSWPTRITLGRILLIAPFVVCMLSMHDPELTAAGQRLARYLAIGLFFLMAISDAVDGYWARRRKQITKLGAFLDPLADKLLITCASLLLVSQRGHVESFLLPMTVVVLIIGKDVLITIGFLVMYLITSHAHIVPVFAGKLSTALQLSMVVAVLIGPDLVEGIPKTLVISDEEIRRPPRRWWPPWFTSAMGLAILKSMSGPTARMLVPSCHWL